MTYGIFIVANFNASWHGWFLSPAYFVHFVKNYNLVIQLHTL